MPENIDFRKKMGMSDALRLASRDMDFAARLVNNPEEFQAAFRLTNDDVLRLKEMGMNALDGVKKVDPRAAD